MKNVYLFIVAVCLMCLPRLVCAQLPDADKVEGIIQKCVDARRQILERELTTLETKKLTDKAIKEMRNSLDKLRYKLHCEIVDVLETANMAKDMSNVKTVCKILELPESEPKTISIPIPSAQVKRLTPGAVVEFTGTLQTTNASWINCFFSLPLTEKNSDVLEGEENYAFAGQVRGMSASQHVSGLPQDDSKLLVALGMKSDKCVILSPTLVKKVVDQVSKPDPRWFIPEHAAPVSGNIP
jgi:hypothetical protein